ncbi:MAG: hypothetical protein KF858_00965 [Candidatus Sumerlaeia bacterium]|nr:hypothetical protein [Candidatus Sumerlaeia bacterium]
MKTRVPALFALLALCLGAAACASRDGRSLSLETLRPAKVQRAWQVSPTPSPIGGLVLVPGETRRLSLRGASAEPLAAITAVEPAQPLPDGIEVLFDAAAERLTIAAATQASGSGLLSLRVTTDTGRQHPVAIPWLVRPWPLVTFSWRAPNPARLPARVFVAGTFNGWSGSKNELPHVGDGLYRIELPLPPGTIAYKFVVDGNWMADPSNPRTDGSGHGNSILDVAGDPEEALDIAFLVSAMPHSGPQGAFRITPPPGVPLVPGRLSVVLNNRPVPPEQLVFTDGNRVVRLNLPADQWFGENFVVLLASDKHGRTGMLQTRVDTASAPRSPRDEVLYFVFTDRFHNGDPSNDPHHDVEDLHPLARYHGGDWEGLRQRIAEGYFRRLGVTTLWLSPANRNTDRIERDALPPHRLFSSYHAYWPTSMTETNPPFGTARELRQLVQTAHGDGIAVLLDFVANHVHESHPLVVEHPDWVTPRLTPDGRPNIRLFDEYPFSTWFDHFLPTLEFAGNDALRDAMVENALFWIERTGADGFRFDAVKHVDLSFWQALSAEIHRRHAVARGEVLYSVGETISDRNTINQFVGPDLLTGQFDFPLLFALQGILGRGNGSMADLAAAARQSRDDYPPHAIMSPLIGNHDVVRFMGIADGDLPDGVDEKEIGYSNPPQVDHPESWRKLRTAFAFLFALPGPPTIYYGDEIGLTGAHDPDNRRPMVWHNWSADQQATFDAVAALARARHGSVALRRGHLDILHADAESLVLLRASPDEAVIAACFRQPLGRQVALRIPGHWGSPKAVEQLAAEGLDAQLDGAYLRVTGGHHSWGLWRLHW